MMQRTTWLFLILVLLSWAVPAMAQEDEDTDIDSELEDIAQLFIEKKQYAEALKVYDELRETNPQSMDVLDMSIELCTKIPACEDRLPDLYSASLEIYEGRYRANPDNLDMLDMNIELCLKIPDCKPRLPEYLQELVAFVKRNPKSVVGREMLVGYALDFKDFKTARAAIEGLVKLKPQDVSNWLWLADYHEQARDFRSLDALVAKLVKRFPKKPEIWLLQADRANSYSNIKRAKLALGKAKALLGPKDVALRKRHDALTKELKKTIYAATEAVYVDYRQDTRWSDLEDDFDHSTYP